MGLASQCLPEAPLDIDTALVWLGKSCMAGPREDRPRHGSLHRDRLRAVGIFLRMGAGRDQLRRMLADGRLERTERVLALMPQRPFARLEPRLRRVLNADFRHLYVLEVPGVGTKIGITTEPNRRLYQHAGAAGRWGRGLGRAWFSIRHAEATANERALIDSEGKRTEVLAAGFDDVIALVERMPMTTIDSFFARWEGAAGRYKPRPRFDPPDEFCLEAVKFARAAFATEVTP